MVELQVNCFHGQVPVGGVGFSEDRLRLTASKEVSGQSAQEEGRG